MTLADSLLCDENSSRLSRNAALLLVLLRCYLHCYRRCYLRLLLMLLSMLATYAELADQPALSCDCEVAEQLLSWLINSLLSDCLMQQDPRPWAAAKGWSDFGHATACHMCLCGGLLLESRRPE